MIAFLPLAMAAVLLASLAAGARRIEQPVLRVLIAVQCGYWALAYLGRGGLLLAVRPLPRRNDTLADPRLFVDGYTSRLAEVLWIVSVGLGAYIVAMWMLQGRFGAAARDWRSSVRCSLLVATIVYLGGWACRLIMLTGADNALISSLALFGPLGAGLLLLKADWLQSKAAFASCSGALLLVEGLYGAVIASKTPVLAVLLFILIGISVRRWRVGLPAIFLGGGLFIIAFTTLQSVKTEAAVAEALDESDRFYPSWAQPALPLLRRFDLLSAATDASLKPVGSWIEWEYLLRLLHGFVPFVTPESWVPYGSAGLSWTAEVRSSSLANAGLEVSLAEGFVAEGYAWLGWWGILLLAAVAALVTIGLSRLLLSGHPIGYSFAILMVSQPTIFERGVLGMAEVAGQSLQASLAFVVVWWLLDGGRGGVPERLAASLGDPRRLSGEVRP